MLDKVNSGPDIKGMYINGQWVGTPNAFDDMNPSDGSVWARIPDGGAAETRAAIEAANNAFPACKERAGIFPNSCGHVLCPGRGGTTLVYRQTFHRDSRAYGCHWCDLTLERAGNTGNPPICLPASSR